MRPAVTDTPPASSLVETPDKGKDSSEPKAGPPTLDEWQDFFARIVLRAGTEFLLNVMLDDVMDQLTLHERDMIRLTSEDLREMAAPFASLANKSKPMRKHGRTIIAAADSWEAVLALGIWLRRVNRISRKYRPAGESRTQRRQRQHEQRAHRAQQSQPPMEGIVITEGMNGHGRVGSDNGAGPQFGIYNPGGGG